jgi:hypothetical protein
MLFLPHKKNPAQNPQQKATKADHDVAPFETRIPGPIVFEDLQNKFRCAVPRGSLHFCFNRDLGQQFSEFYVSTDPDLEDFASGDLFEKDNFEPIPEMSLPTEDEHSEDEITNYGEDPEVPHSCNGTTQAAGNTDPREGRLREPPTVLWGKTALDDLRNLYIQNGRKVLVILTWK